MRSCKVLLFLVFYPGCRSDDKYDEVWNVFSQRRIQVQDIHLHTRLCDCLDLLHPLGSNHFPSDINVNSHLKKTKTVWPKSGTELYGHRHTCQKSLKHVSKLSSPHFALSSDGDFFFLSIQRSYT